MSEAIVETRGFDTPYQTVIKFAESGPRIHIFWRGDGDPDMHDHPADFWTFPLVSYVEEIQHAVYSDYKDWRVVRAFTIHRRKAEFAHRVLGSFDGAYEPLSTMEAAAGLQPVPVAGNRPIVTLVWWGKKRREWGFHSFEGWRGWRSYLGICPADASERSEESSPRQVERADSRDTKKSIPKSAGKESAP